MTGFIEDESEDDEKSYDVEDGLSYKARTLDIEYKVRWI